MPGDTPHNPYTATRKLTLSDGVERTLRFGTNETVLFEEATGLKTGQLLQALLAGGSIRTIRAAVYAGLSQDALDRKEKEPWTLARAGDLIDPRRFVEVQNAVREALAEALAGPEALRKSPEKQASERPATAPRPGRGKKR